MEKGKSTSFRNSGKGWMFSYLVGLMIALPASAQGPGWTAVSTVVEIVTVFDGGINVRLSPDLTGCVSQSGYGSAHASIYVTHGGINRMKADLTVALVTGAKVMLYFDDNQCRVQEMRLLPPQ